MATTKSKNLTGEKYYKKLKDKDLKVSNELYDNQVKSINRDYDTQVFEQGKAYEDQYRENAVQKEINKRQVAESMANLGLTDSGLNRTQQTAVQLSYGNNKANIDRQRQSGIDSLNYSRRQALDTTEQNRLAANAQIEQGYAEKAAAYDENQKAEAKNMVLSFLEIGAEPPKDMIALSGISDSELNGYRNYYKKALAAAKVTSSSKQKDNQKPLGIINTNGSNLSLGMKGTFDDNDVTVTAVVKDGITTGYKYTDNKTGKSTTFSVGVNPFTGINNKDASLNNDTTKAVAQYETFENGYQPKGVFYNGKDYGWVSFSGIRDEINGNMQNVHRTEDGSLWIWDRTKNKYIPYQE